MPQGFGSTIFLSWKTIDKECINKLPTFIDIEKHFFNPSKETQTTIDPQTCT